MKAFSQDRRRPREETSGNFPGGQGDVREQADGGNPCFHG
jgi:hypothetical protein